MPDSGTRPASLRPRLPLIGVRAGMGRWVGAWMWLLAGPLFLIGQLVVAAAWRTPFSWAANNISDLGNVQCGLWGENGRYVCSPLHWLMNATFVTTGLLVMAGTVLLRRCELLGRSRVGRVLVALAAAGYVAAGLAPADAHENVHVVLGAVPIFFAGNLGLLLFAASSGPVLRPVRIAGLVAGGVGLAGAVLFLQQRYLALGMGGMERVTVLPLHAFLLVAALVLLRWRRGQDRREAGGARHRTGAQSTGPS